MRPRVIIHNGVSLDGRLDWYTGDVGLYYELAARFQAGATLCGSNTILTAFVSENLAPGAEPDQALPPESKPDHWLIIVDSRGRIRNLAQLRRQPYWRDVIILCSQATPPAHLDYLRQQEVEYLITGTAKVDLPAALTQLKACYGFDLIRIDSGGTLNGVLLRAGLVDEVSLLVNPTLVGGTSPQSIFVAPDLTSTAGIIPLKLTHLEQLPDDILWLRYEVSPTQ
jgi:2,5-diamino-6-(ribosylamino)-4(3H)-pyrimidinone 5'-phosphate reductase